MLEIKHLSYQVEGESGEELGILNDVSLTVADHQFVVITGPNGGGKTTLAKAIMGLVRPTRGHHRLEWHRHHRPGHHPAGPPGGELRLSAAAPLQGPAGAGICWPWPRAARS